MKSNLLLIVSLCASLLVANSFGKASAEIPVPKQPIRNAISTAREALYTSSSKETGERFARDLMKRVIVLRAEYTREFVYGRDPDQRKEFKNWYWVITLVDRTQNDHSWVYRIDDRARAVLILSSI